MNGSRYFTYFMQCAALGLVKIGRSRNPAVRRLNIQSIAKNPVKILAVFSPEVLSEKAAHARFSDQRKHSEWFRITSADVESLRKEIPDIPIPVVKPRKRKGSVTYPHVPLEPSVHAELKALCVERGMLMHRLFNNIINNHLGKK